MPHTTPKLATPTPADLEALLRPEEAAELLCVTPSALERWRRVAAGPAYVRVGRLPRYEPAAIREYIARRTCAGEAG